MQTCPRAFREPARSERTRVAQGATGTNVRRLTRPWSGDPPLASLSSRTAAAGSVLIFTLGQQRRFHPVADL